MSRLTPRIAPYAFLAPAIVVTLVFTLYPLAQSMVLSGEQTYGPAATRWVGLDNFARLLDDPLFWTAVRNTTVYSLASLFIQLPLAFGLAMLLDRPSLRGRNVYRAIFFVPQLMGLAFAAVLGALAFEKRAGLVNIALHWLVAKCTGNALGWDLDFPWLQSHIMPTLIVISLWMYVGYNMVFFLAALQNVDRSLTEAAMIDGAGPLTRLRHVTLPAVRPVAVFVVLLSLTGSFQLFELPYILLDESGGPRNGGLTIVMYLYQRGFQQGDLGYASAIGWVLGVGLIGLALAMTPLLWRRTGE